LLFIVFKDAGGRLAFLYLYSNLLGSFFLASEDNDSLKKPNIVRAPVSSKSAS